MVWEEDTEGEAVLGRGQHDPHSHHPFITWREALCLLALSTSQPWDDPWPSNTAEHLSISLT